MNISYHQLAIQSTIHALKNLAHILKKGQDYCVERKLDENVLLQARLFPDMYPLVKQVQIASDISKLGAARLTGTEAPSFPDTETTFEQLQERIAKTISYLATVPENAFAESAKREITLHHAPNLPMTGEAFLMQVVVPNIYFHIVTTYDILRHNGVTLGKDDFTGKKSH